MTPLLAYQHYSSLKLHYSSSKYDIAKYGISKKRFGIDKFNKRNEKYLFEKLAKTFPDEYNLNLFLASNFVYDPNIWVGDLMSDGANEKYYRMKKVLSALSYHFMEDTKTINKNVPFQQAFKTTEDALPMPIKMMMSGDIHPETIVMYQRIFGVLNKVDNRMSEAMKALVWEKLKNRLQAHIPFVTIRDVSEIEAMKSQLINYIKHN